jgi:hypothetical protein
MPKLTVSASKLNENSNLTKSVSTGSISSNKNVTSQFSNSLLDFNLDTSSITANNKAKTTITTTSSNNSNNITPKNESLFDLDLNFNTSTVSTNAISSSINTSTNPVTNIPLSMSLSKVALENNLYNIDEDKEVESSFQYGQIDSILKKNSTVASSSPMNLSILNPTMQSSSNLSLNQQSLMNVSNILNTSTISTTTNTTTNGRFTPACFPGRTTPIASLSASLFEQGTRASIVSPLTLNGSGTTETIPIAIEFKETIHSYFKIGDPTKFKIKCFGSMKISFPFAIIKLLAVNGELPQLEFRLSQLQIANQDLKVNSQLLTNSTLFDPDLKFKFISSNLVSELKQQHQQNKQAAFFNFELLKYELKYVQAAPLIISAQWSHNKTEKTIELNLDYTFVFRKSLSQVNFMIVMPPVSTRVHLIKSEPNCSVQDTKFLWQMPVVNSNGSLTAKFAVSGADDEQNLEKFYQPIYAKFHIDNETLSQVKFDITSGNYKLSLLKSTIETGKYFCNYDQSQTQTTTSTSPQSQMPVLKKPPLTGSLSTSIGSTADVLLNY